MAESEFHLRLERLARSRIAAQKGDIEHSIRQIAAGNPLGAERTTQRSVDRIAAKAGIPARDATAVAASIARTADAIDRRGGAEGGPEALQGPTIDFVGVEFLARGRIAANAVGRVVLRNGRAQGTGFLVGAGLFITNNHVIASPAEAAGMLVEFDYESADDGGARPVTTFALDPRRCFVFDPVDRLDFTLIALNERVSGRKQLVDFGYMPLSDAPDKHMLGEIANIIQHPQGRMKQVVVRENSLVSRDETHQVLHYIADTEPGSSGSPVCNNEWEPIALHHWGGPALELTGADGRPLPRDINEGIRISAIVGALRRGRPRSAGDGAATVREVLSLWDSRPRRGPVAPEGGGTAVEAAGGFGSPRLGPDGAVTWTFPIEISVRAPFAGAPRGERPSAPAAGLETSSAAPRAAERRRASATDFEDRGGYEPGFIPGFVVPLPGTDRVPYRLAENSEAADGDDPHELRYHHFSIKLNAERRLAAFTACNIDGRRAVAVNRRDKTTNISPTLSDLGVESLGAEASDDFSPDPRVPDAEQMAREFYEDQVVPGFDKPVFPGSDATKEERSAYQRAMNERTARMFQKGHLIMRGDPAWGTAEEALAAEADTFFYTNAAPQLGYFNQGSPEDRPGAKGKLRWRAVETYVLRNAVTTRQRICVFAGPVFDENDIDYRFGSKLPLRFWKVVVWAEGGTLRSIALLADQGPVLKKLTQGVPERAEAFDDEEELARVSEFLTTVEEIEGLTHLDFGAEVRGGDVRRGRRRGAPAVDAGPDVLIPRSGAAGRRMPARGRRPRPS
jgi:endonuclease G